MAPCQELRLRILISFFLETRLQTAMFFSGVACFTLGGGGRGEGSTHSGPGSNKVTTIVLCGH